MVPMRDSRIVETLSEPAEAPQGLDCRNPRLWRENGRADRFIAPLRDSKIVGSPYGPRLGALASLPAGRGVAWELAGRDAGAPSMATGSWPQCGILESWGLPMKTSPCALLVAAALALAGGWV